MWGFCSFPGPLHTVQRADLWGVILALQASEAIHLDVDNLHVVRHVGRLVDGNRGVTPVELLNDGDLILLVDRMLEQRGRGAVRISKIKGHPEEDMVLAGRVWELHRVGNNAADEAADFGRRRVGHAVIDVRRYLAGVCGCWYPVMLELHRFALPSLGLQ